MKRFLLSAALAIAFHVFLLGATPRWLTKKFHPKPRTRAVTLSLAFHQPETLRPKPAALKAESPPKKPLLVVKKEEERPVPKPTPKPPKKILRRPRPEPTPKKVLKRPKPKLVMKPVKPKRRPPPPTVASAETQSVQPMPQQVSGIPDVRKKPAKSLPDIAEDMVDESTREEKSEIAPVPPVPPVREARPMYRKNPSPAYPRLARRRAYQGTVVLEVLVDEEGRVDNLRVLRSSGHQILDRAAVKSVKTWLFEPGTKGDERVAMWVRVPIRFQLK